MHRFSHLSDHAEIRVDERTSLNRSALARQIDRGAVLSLGCVPGFNREHLLLHSGPDDRCFVVVRDRVCGTVVTVLPLDYHDAWAVTDAQCAQAKGLYEADLLAQDDQRHKALALACPDPSMFIVNGLLIQEHHYRSTCLFKRPATPYGHCLGSLFRDPRLLGDAIEALMAKGHTPDALLGISVRLGKKGLPVSVAVVQTPEGLYFDQRELPPVDQVPVNDVDASGPRRTLGRVR